MTVNYAFYTDLDDRMACLLFRLLILPVWLVIKDVSRLTLFET